MSCWTSIACAWSWWRAIVSVESRVARRPSSSTIRPTPITSAGMMISTPVGEANSRAIRASRGRSPGAVIVSATRRL